MYIDKDNFEEWMNQLMKRFDALNTKLESVIHFDQRINGDVLLDNQDLMSILKVSQRTLQRIRNSGLLPYKSINKKNYYLKSDVEKFIKEHFGKDSKHNSDEENQELK